MHRSMRKYGLIGYPITYSFSPSYFKNKFEVEGIEDAQYDLYPLKHIDEYQDLKGKAGLNVTIPYKEQVIPFLDELDQTAEEIGAVNTIKFLPNGKTKGFNTDIYGFEHSLKPLWEGRSKPASALILGTGGASKAIQYVLNKLGIHFQRISRKEGKGDMTYMEINNTILTEYSLIVNTTPLGTYPKVDAAPDLPYVGLTSRNKLYDLVYNPEKTLFLKRGLVQNCQVKNGLEMLHLQAEKAWEIWTT